MGRKGGGRVVIVAPGGRFPLLHLPFRGCGRRAGGAATVRAQPTLLGLICRFPRAGCFSFSPEFSVQPGDGAWD